jgi:hypothetical protein
LNLKKLRFEFLFWQIFLELKSFPQIGSVSMAYQAIPNLFCKLTISHNLELPFLSTNYFGLASIIIENFQSHNFSSIPVKIIKIIQFIKFKD